MILHSDGQQCPPLFFFFGVCCCCRILFGFLLLFHFVCQFTNVEVKVTKYANISPPISSIHSQSGGGGGVVQYLVLGIRLGKPEIIIMHTLNHSMAAARTICRNSASVILDRTTLTQLFFLGRKPPKFPTEGEKKLVFGSKIIQIQRYCVGYKAIASLNVY